MRFAFHQGDVQQSVIVGPTGKGMSTAESFNAHEHMEPLNDEERARQQNAAAYWDF